MEVKHTQNEIPTRFPEAEGFFEIDPEGKGEKGTCYLAYVKAVGSGGGRALDLVHTWTPQEMRGKGMAEVVTRAAFDWARENGVKVIPSCTYISGKFLHKFPEYQGLVENHPS